MPDYVSQKELAIERLNRKKAETAHIANKANPHEVTKTQIGLTNVTDDAQVKKIASSVSGNLMTWNGTSGDTPADVGYAGSALVKSTIRQDASGTASAANTAVTNREEIVGWGYIRGDDTRLMNVTVYFDPVTQGNYFDDDFIIVSAEADGAMAYGSGPPTTPAPADPCDLVTASGLTTAKGETPTRAGFSINLMKVSNDGAAPAAFLTTYYYGYKWRAIGAKAR